MKLMVAYFTAWFCLTCAAAAKDLPQITLPSGLQTQLFEMLWDRPGNGLVYRFRFVSAAFSADGADFDVVSSDLEYLCNKIALPKLSNTGPAPSQVIISLADRESEFGVFDPDVSQVFEAYRVEDESCIWEIH